MENLDSTNTIALSTEELISISGGDAFMFEFGQLLGAIWKAYGESMSYQGGANTSGPHM